MSINLYVRTEHLCSHRPYRVDCHGVTMGMYHCALENTHPFNGPFSGTTRVRRYQKGKINLDFTEARNSKWQWHQLDLSAPRSRQITMPAPHRSVFYSGCPSCHPTNSVKALKANILYSIHCIYVNHPFHGHFTSQHAALAGTSS